MSKVEICYDEGNNTRVAEIDTNRELIINGLGCYRYITHNNNTMELVVTNRDGKFRIKSLMGVRELTNTPQTTDTITEIMKIYNTQIMSGSYEEQVRETLSIAVNKGLFENKTFPLND